MTYEWDPTKARNNARKHNVRFPDAATSLEDPQALRFEDNDPTEERFIAIGMDSFGRVLVTIYTWRGDSYRIISSRKASASEQRTYEGARP